MVDARLFSLGLSCTFNNLQVTNGCLSPSKYMQVPPIMGCIMGCENGGQVLCVKGTIRRQRRVLNGETSGSW